MNEFHLDNRALKSSETHSNQLFDLTEVKKNQCCYTVKIVLDTFCGPGGWKYRTKNTYEPFTANDTNAIDTLLPMHNCDMPNAEQKSSAQHAHSHTNIYLFVSVPLNENISLFNYRIIMPLGDISIL